MTELDHAMRAEIRAPRVVAERDLYLRKTVKHKFMRKKQSPNIVCRKYLLKPISNCIYFIFCSRCNNFGEIAQLGERSTEVSFSHIIERSRVQSTIFPYKS
jgi:hypothetical protein